MTWPATPEDLAREQERLARLGFELWTPPAGPHRVGACAVVFGRAGSEGVGWAAAVVELAGKVVATSYLSAAVEAPFQPGQLALREGAILEEAVRQLPIAPDVLLVAAAGRDHARRAGLALQLGAVLDLPTVGVTDEPLVATGRAPGARRGARAPLRVGGELVAFRVRTRGGTKPLVAHAAWRTDPEAAAEVVLGSCALARWPDPLRLARQVAREIRAQDA
jgi:deoxyribonuclease V